MEQILAKTQIQSKLCKWFTFVIFNGWITKQSKSCAALVALHQPLQWRNGNAHNSLPHAARVHSYNGALEFAWGIAAISVPPPLLYAVYMREGIEHLSRKNSSEYSWCVCNAVPKHVIFFGGARSGTQDHAPSLCPAAAVYSMCISTPSQNAHASAKNRPSVLASRVLVSRVGTFA